MRSTTASPPSIPPPPILSAIPGATIFNSSKANGKSSWSVGPRVGFAYSLNPKTVIRGGYGMYYAGVQADSWDPYPVDGYQTNPVAPNTTNGACSSVLFQRHRTCPTNPDPAHRTQHFLRLAGGTISLPPQLKPTYRMVATPLGLIREPTPCRGTRTGRSRSSVS